MPPQHMYLLARAPDPADMAIVDSLMREAMAEVDGDSTEQSSSGQEPSDPSLRGRGGLRWVRPAEDGQEEEEEHAMSASPWARRRLGDEWYEVRCVRCSACHRAINATARAKRGQRCAGCLRWYHDGCAPAGTLPASKALRESDPTTSDFFCSAACGAARAALTAQAGPAQAPGCKALADGRAFCLIDCHRLRQHLNPGPYQSSVASSASGGAVPGGAAAPADADKKQQAPPRTSEPFKRIAREELRVMKRLGQPPPALVSDLKQPGDEAEAGAPGQPGGALSEASWGKGARSGLAAVVKIFNSYDRTETEGDLLQDGWLALLRAPDGKPVSAASLLAFGADHARLQGLVTAPAHRRQGHARALVSELQAWLQAAGVPRLVAVLPERRAVVGAAEAQGPDGEGVLRKLGFTTLQDLDVLGVWKEVHYPFYTGQLLGRRPRVLLKPTSAGGKQRWPW